MLNNGPSTLATVVAVNCRKKTLLQQVGSEHHGWAQKAARDGPGNIIANVSLFISSGGISQADIGDGVYFCYYCDGERLSQSTAAN